MTYRDVPLSSGARKTALITLLLLLLLILLWLTAGPRPHLPKVGVAPVVPSMKATPVEPAPAPGFSQAEPITPYLNGLADIPYNDPALAENLGYETGKVVKLPPRDESYMKHEAGRTYILLLDSIDLARDDVRAVRQKYFNGYAMALSERMNVPVEALCTSTECGILY